MGKPGPEDIVEDSAVKEVKKPESDNRENTVYPNNENVVNDNVVNPDKEIEPQNVVSEIKEEAQESEENQDTPIRNST